MGRFATGLVIVSFLLPVTARSTTAPSLSGRIHIDGVLDEYAPDEWVLDSASPFPERDDDSAWGSDDEITRVAITWDHDFLYVAVEGRAFDSFLSAFVANRAGGLRTLEDAGEFRRAIELPGKPVNLVALAQPGRIPDVARADDSHPFARVDENTLRRAVSGVRGGPVGFEMAVPWSMLALTGPVWLVAAITGEPGTGAGDTAPDASTWPDDDPFARAVLDRLLMVHADDDHDGMPDDGVNVRNAVAMWGTDATRTSQRPDVSLSATRRAFAPDRGEETEIRLDVQAGDGDLFYFTFNVYSMEGERVRVLQGGDPLAFGDGSLLLHWDGTNDRGQVVRGGAYVVVADWGHTRGAKDGRAKTAVVVAR